MPDLTDAARRNVESGAQTGPGTNVCGTCGGTKEDSRLNSRQCRACSKGAGPGTEAPSEPETPRRSELAELREALAHHARVINNLRRRVAALEGASPSTRSQDNVSRNEEST